jgi:hypothetical protein
MNTTAQNHPTSSEDLLPQRTPNRRAEARKPCRFVATVYGESSNAPAWAMLRNISTNGIGFLASVDFAVGDLVTVQVFGQDSQQLLVVQVRHNRRELSGWFHGCKVVLRTGDTRRTPFVRHRDSAHG